MYRHSSLRFKWYSSHWPKIRKCLDGIQVNDINQGNSLHYHRPYKIKNLCNGNMIDAVFRLYLMILRIMKTIPNSKPNHLLNEANLFP